MTFHELKIPIIEDGKVKYKAPIHKLSAMHYNNILTAPPNFIEEDILITKAKKIFGITKNPMDAGYILPDGQMLNLLRNKDNKFNFIEHSSISKIEGISGDLPYDRVIDFINRTGSLRISISKEKVKDVFENEEESIPDKFKNQKILMSINIQGGIKNKINRFQWDTINKIYNNVFNPYIYFDVGYKSGVAKTVEEMKLKLI